MSGDGALERPGRPVEHGSTLHVEHLGRLTEVPADGWLTIGREGDLVLDDNPYLHRSFLQLGRSDGLWWIVNVGDLLSATVADADGRVQAWLAPGARLPVVFERTSVRFTAGPSAYHLELQQSGAVFSSPPVATDSTGDTTVGMVPFTPSQRLLILALAEPVLRQHGRSSAAVPTSAEAARRLGWGQTRFNRKLDNVCQKLAKIGVQGVHGAPGELASNRRARLVEFAVAVRLVTADDLELLDQPQDDVED